MAGKIRIPPYKDFLQPALQRRFASAAFTLFVSSYAQALLLSDWKRGLWTLQPVGSTGIRAALLFLSGLVVLTVHIAFYHVGIQTSHSPLGQLARRILSLQTLQLLFWYNISALLFNLVYLSSGPDDGSWRLVTQSHNKRAFLNERPIFFLCFTSAVSAVEVLLYRFYDHDRLNLDGLLDKLASKIKKNEKVVSDDGSNPKQQQQQQRRRRHQQPANIPAGPLARILRETPKTLVSCVSGSGIIAVFMMPIYMCLLRGTARWWFMFFLRPWYPLPKSNIIPSGFPFDVALIASSVYAGFHLFLTWTVAHDVFGFYMAREPLKEGSPLTNDSKDPNGSLVNGLKSEKLRIQTFAMWELRYMVDMDDATRRKGIYDDIDRKDGTMWSQVYRICMGIVGGIETRVDDVLYPLPAEEEGGKARTERALSVPRAPVVESTRDGFEKEMRHWISDVALAPGQSPADRLAPHIKKYAGRVEAQVLGPKGLGAVLNNFRGALSRFIGLPYVRDLYQQKFEQRFTKVVLGSPYVEKTLFLNAAHVLGALACHSIKEDDFGNVHRDVGDMVRRFTAILSKVDLLREEFPPHWTEVVAAGGGPLPKRTPDVDCVMRQVRESLRDVVDAFRDYRAELRITLQELQLADEAVIELDVEESDGKLGSAAGQLEEPAGPKLIEAGEVKAPERRAEPSEREREREREKEREREREREREKERTRDERDKERESTSSDKQRERERRKARKATRAVATVERSRAPEMEHV